MITDHYLDRTRGMRGLRGDVLGEYIHSMSSSFSGAQYWRRSRPSSFGFAPQRFDPFAADLAHD
jgi:hypothetical protein